MKIYILITILFLGYFSKTQAQTWCPSGATWYYGDDNIHYTGFRLLTYINDTVINGITFKKITDKSHGYDGTTTYNWFRTPIFSYSQAGVVYLYTNRNVSYQFDTLYYINAQIGDSWRMAFADTTCNNTLGFVKVLNIGNRNINGTNLKWLYTKCKTYGYTGTETYDTIYERMGLINNFLYYLTDCGTSDNEIPTFRCYSDNTFGSFTNYSNPCDYYETGIYELSNSTQIKISPNPFTSQTTISFSSEQTNTTIKITDILGKEIKALNFTGKDCIIEKGTMQAGIYFVQITSFDKLRMTQEVENRKVVVQ